jgi:ABC-2 type transport system permease protein
MSELRIVLHVMWRELYSRRKAFLVSTAITVSVVVGGVALAGRAASSSAADPGVAIGVLPGVPVELETQIRVRLAPDTPLQMVSFTNSTDGEAALRDGDISALVVAPRRVLWGPAASSGIVDTVSVAMRAVHLMSVSDDLGLTETDLSRLLAPVEGESIRVEGVDESAQVVAVITVILMFVAIIAYGQWLAYGVVEEKANRVAEVILGALSPTQVLTAKMMSIGGLGLLQLTIVGGLGLVGVIVFTDIEVPPLTGAALGWVLVWFLLGYAFYGALYSAAGSLAADTQEAGSAIGPLNLLPGIGYMLGVISFSAGSDLVARILSFIPLWTPLLMPGRVARGSAATWEVALSIALMAAATLVMVRVASRVYLGGITQATRTVGWRQAFRGGKEYAVGK